MDFHAAASFHMRERLELPAKPEYAFPFPEDETEREMIQPGKVRRLAVITGASSGLGTEFARLAAADGFETLLIARRMDRLQALSSELKKKYDVEAHVLGLDLTEPGAPGRVMEALDAIGLVPDVLVNNAGFGACGSSLDMDPARLRRMLELNAGALTELSLRIGREMRDMGRGRIMNVASTAAFQACPYLGVYGATKAYVLSFTEALAEELRGTAVTATAFCPGPTRTEFGDAAGLAKENAFDLCELESAERPADAAARTGWEGMMAGRRIVIDGWGNRVIARLAWALPRGIVSRLAAFVLKRLKTES